MYYLSAVGCIAELFPAEKKLQEKTIQEDRVVNKDETGDDSVPDKTKRSRKGNKKCPKCGTEQRSNAAPRCFNCAYVFVKKLSVRPEAQKVSKPDLLDTLVASYREHTMKADSIKTAIRIIADVTGMEMPRLYGEDL